MKDLCQPHENNALFGVDLQCLQQSITAIPVSPKVPTSITELLDVARKLLLYCYYEWDFYTVSFVYLFLISETAMKTRFVQQLPEPCTIVRKDAHIAVAKNYDILFSKLHKGWRIEGYERINGSLGSISAWLMTNVPLPERHNEFVVNTIRDLRNYAAHLSMKHLWPPAIVIQQLWKVTDFINCLYDPHCHASEPKILKESRERYRALDDEGLPLAEDDSQNQ
jgi:hypothetical protein